MHGLYGRLTSCHCSCELWQSWQNSKLQQRMSQLLRQAVNYMWMSLLQRGNGDTRHNFLLLKPNYCWFSFYLPSQIYDVHDRERRVNFIDLFSIIATFFV